MVVHGLCGVEHLVRREEPHLRLHHVAVDKERLVLARPAVAQELALRGRSVGPSRRVQQACYLRSWTGPDVARAGPGVEECDQEGFEAALVESLEPRVGELGQDRALGPPLGPLSQSVAHVLRVDLVVLVRADPDLYHLLQGVRRDVRALEAKAHEPEGFLEVLLEAGEGDRRLLLAAACPHRGAEGVEPLLERLRAKVPPAREVEQVQRRAELGFMPEAALESQRDLE